MKMLENWLAKPGNQWEGWEVCEGSAKVKFLWHCSLEGADVMASYFGE